MTTAEELIKLEGDIMDGKFTEGQAIWQRGWTWQNMSLWQKLRYYFIYKLNNRRYKNE